MQQLESLYTTLLQATEEDDVWDPCSALQSMLHAHLMQCRHRSSQPLYAAYIDDTMLAQVCTQSAKTD